MAEAFPRQKLRVTLVAVLMLLIGFSSLEGQDSRELQPAKQGEADEVFELPTWGKPVTVTIPKGFRATFRQGPDFDVCYFRPTNQKDKALLGIYFGMAPDAHWPEDAPKTSGQVNGKNVTWHSWKATREGSTRFYRETLLKNFFPADTRTVVHIFISATSEEQVNQLAESVSSLKLKSTGK